MKNIILQNCIVLILKNKKLKISLYDKRTDFNFDIVRYPDINSNISATTLRVVAYSQIG